MEMLRLYYPDSYDQLIATATRFPKPKSKIAENITVIDKKEIEEMNAHTLGDVLNGITGLVVSNSYKGGPPGRITSADIQGAFFGHVRLVIDGVTVNEVVQSYGDLSLIPAQIIESIEIIKGPASAAWGSSLGGVINVITKAGGVRRLGGTLSTSYGKSNTGDYRLEANGRTNNLTYYLYGGNLSSNGFGPYNEVHNNTFYSKFNYDIAEKADVGFSFGYGKHIRDAGYLPEEDYRGTNDTEFLYGTLAFNYSVNAQTALNVSASTVRHNALYSYYTLSASELWYADYFPSRRDSVNAKLKWEHGAHTAVFGIDYEKQNLTSLSVGGSHSISDAAFYANDTIALGRLSITPGIRLNHNSASGDFLSPTLGVTYKLADRTLLTASIARGFSSPLLGSVYYTDSYTVPATNVKPEKIWSFQGGIETSSIKYVKVKANLFRHNMSDSPTWVDLPDGTYTYTNALKRYMQGFELEVNTIPVYNASLSGGIAYIDARDAITDEKLQEIPRITYDIGLRYDDKKSFTASLKGRRIVWHYDSADKAVNNTFIFNLNMSKKIYTTDKKTIDIFMTAHNLFNGKQALYVDMPYSIRWLEAGMRYKF